MNAIITSEIRSRLFPLQICLIFLLSCLLLPETCLLCSQTWKLFTKTWKLFVQICLFCALACLLLAKTCLFGASACLLSAKTCLLLLSACLLFAKNIACFSKKNNDFRHIYHAFHSVSPIINSHRLLSLRGRIIQPKRKVSPPLAGLPPQPCHCCLLTNNEASLITKKKFKAFDSSRAIRGIYILSYWYKFLVKMNIFLYHQLRKATSCASPYTDTQKCRQKEKQIN